MLFKKKKTKHFLSIIAIFKNESHCIEEWIEHYLNEGVDHFYLIDNGSTDDSVDKIRKYQEKELVSLVHDKTKWSQVELYNQHFLQKKDESEWWLVCDLDEFLYARKGLDTIVQYLETRNSNIGMIYIPWKMFGSSNYESQPKSLRQSFIKRCIYNGKVNPGMNNNLETLGKVLTRTKFLSKIDIHFAKLRGRYVVEDSRGIQISFNESSFISTSEELLSNAFLHLNHYPIQSKNWFMKVKAVRGAADSKHHEQIRNGEYFELFDRDSNVLTDNELATKRRNC